MDSIFHFDLETFIQAIGYIGVFAIVFAESGLLVGFFLPGDSLLFTAGLLSAQGYFNVWIMAALAVIGAIIGDNVGYAFGRRVGPKLFTREASFWFHKDHITKAEKFYEKHGGKTIILARFIPIIRTFAPIVAGVGKMDYKIFLRYNIIGGLLWGAGVTLLGYFLGQLVPDAEKYLLYIVIAIIILSVVPVIIPMFCRPFGRSSDRTREHD